MVKQKKKKTRKESLHTFWGCSEQQIDGVDTRKRRESQDGKSASDAISLFYNTLKVFQLKTCYLVFFTQLSSQCEISNVAVRTIKTASWMPVMQQFSPFGHKTCKVTTEVNQHIAKGTYFNFSAAVNKSRNGYINYRPMGIVKLKLLCLIKSGNVFKLIKDLIRQMSC